MAGKPDSEGPSLTQHHKFQARLGLRGGPGGPGTFPPATAQNNTPAGVWPVPWDDLPGAGFSCVGTGPEGYGEKESGSFPGFTFHPQLSMVGRNDLLG